MRIAGKNEGINWFNQYWFNDVSWSEHFGDNREKSEDL